MSIFGKGYFMRDRHATWIFDGPVKEDGWGERVEVSAFHDKDRKRYVARVSLCEYSRRDGYTVTRFEVFSGHSVNFMVRDVARFSQSAFETFCDDVAASCVAVEAQPTEEAGRAAEMLRKAREFAGVPA